MQNIIPTLDLKDFFKDNKSKATFVAQLKNSFETTGFFFLKNHSIDRDYLWQAKKLFGTFFKLAEQTRKKYEYASEFHQRGYTPMKVEKGEFAGIADEKHFFQIGKDRTVNVLEIPRFERVTRLLFDGFRDKSLVLLEAIALSLGLQSSYFSEKEGNSIMRAIEYPANENPLADDGVATAGGNVIGMCASKHTDINMITLLEAQEEGLQLWYKNSWLPITITDPDVIVVNAGDMLQHLTGGRYISGLHRVVCQRNIRRFSIPYFCHLNLEESVVPLQQLGESDLVKYHFQTVGEYLNFRLKQIGL
jgi:isopenicillin N synthase-like dioxygenase